MNKKKLIKFRCTSLEKALIQKKAENTGLSTSEFCRSSALGLHVKSKLTAEEIEIYKDLAKFHKNFMSLSNLFKEKDPSLSNETRLLAKEIKEHLQKL